MIKDLFLIVAGGAVGYVVGAGEESAVIRALKSAFVRVKARFAKAKGAAGSTGATK